MLQQKRIINSKKKKKKKKLKIPKLAKTTQLTLAKKNKKRPCKT